MWLLKYCGRKREAGVYHPFPDRLPPGRLFRNDFKKFFFLHASSLDARSIRQPLGSHRAAFSFLSASRS
jgi:hypothetical protein